MEGEDLTKTFVFRSTSQSVREEKGGLLKNDWRASDLSDGNV